MDIHARTHTIRIKGIDHHNRQMGQWLSRHADENRLQELDRQFAMGQGDGKLRITYVMNHVRVCGGAKIVLEHTNQLTSRGHHVTIVCPDPRPQWMEVKADYVQVPQQMALAHAIPESDVIVCTVVDQLFQCYSSQKAPVVHFEQGDVYIYDFEKVAPGLQDLYRKLWSVPVPILAVSGCLARHLQQNFNRGANVLHNALNDKVFYPREENRERSKRPRILFVGPEQVAFKGVADIRRAFELVRQSGRDFEPVWVTQVAPESPFEGELVVNPSQERLGEVYRSCDLYVSGSYFESFPLPPLEAMTSGCAVISTRNEGILEYGVDGVNCLLTEIGDPQGLAAAIIELLDHEDKRSQLVESGYETAKRFTWERITDELEAFLHDRVQAQGQQAESGATLRIERLPQGLPVIAALDRINSVQMTMEEDWCLWLVEGETLSERAEEQVRRIVQEPIDDTYALSVRYPDDVSEHPLLRWECRLIKRRTLFDASFAGERVAVDIGSGSEGYFLPLWLGKTRTLYREQRFGDVITVLQGAYAQASANERALIIKWLVLALIEQDLFSQAVSLLKDAVEQYPFGTDVFYLYGRIALMLQEEALGRTLMSLALQSGTALLFDECFADMESVCEMYVG